MKNRKYLVILLCLTLILSLVSCAKKESKVPSVRYEDGDIYVNGKFITSSERFAVERIDGHVVSLISDSGYINLDPEGNEISLRDVIKNRRRYKSALNNKIQGLMMTPLTMDSVREDRMDYDEMLSYLSDYDEAMKLPFFFTEDAVHIIYKDEEGNSASVSYSFKADHLNPDYGPCEGVTCRAWMMGRLGYETPGLMLDEYVDHWVENSLEIKNYEGETYYWFCIAYKDEEENKTYYSVIARKEEKGRTIIHSEQVDGPFYCCDFDEFCSLVTGTIKINALAS